MSQDINNKAVLEANESQQNSSNSSSSTPLQLNVAHTAKQKQHYETHWKPITLGDVSIHKRGFSPSVYRHPTPEEFKSDAEHSYNPTRHSYVTEQQYIKQRRATLYGYRKQKYVVGLTNIGYFDLDDITTTSATLELPTVENVSRAMQAEGMWCYIHPSASRKANKLRVLYRRNLTVFSTNHFNPLTREWSLNPSKIGEIKAITDNNIYVPVNQDIKILVDNILHKELETFKLLLDKHNINSSGLDSTSLHSHMHSKHLTNNGDKYLPSIVVDGKEVVSWT